MRWPLMLTLLSACGAPAPTVRSTPAVQAPRFTELSGFWSTERCDAVLARTETFEVAADTSGLTDGERRALTLLMEVGEIFHEIYAESRHPEALAVDRHLAQLTPDHVESQHLDALRRMQALFQGPIAIDDENERVPFAPVRPYEPGRNVYPLGLTSEVFDAYRQAHPDQAGLSAVRTVVRRRDAATLSADRATFEAHPWLAALHPTLGERLAGPPDATELYAIPYALAYAARLARASGLLFSAASEVRPDDDDLADYLEQRARDLLSNDYEAGDAAWVAGSFQRLNAEVGAYETYDDHLSGQKAFHAVSLLVRAPAESAALAQAVAQLPAFEAALPGGPYETVRGRIPVGIYDVVADYGQARGGNTASILPNEAHVTRKYGRTILVRRNVLTHPVFVSLATQRFQAAVTPSHSDDLGPRGNFDRTVWHEVGHYLGPKSTTDGRVVTEALGNLHNHIEELKADLVSLWLMPRLVDAGILSEERRRSAYAAGVLRSLVTRPPARTSPYQTMRLMQQNWLLAHGVLSLEDGHFSVNYDAFPAAVEGMLTEVLQIQRGGDRTAAETFVERWARWDDAVQGRMAPRLNTIGARFYIPRYAALAPEG